MAKNSRDIIRRQTKIKFRRRHWTRFYSRFLIFTFLFLALVLLSHSDRLLIKKLSIVGQEAVISPAITVLIKNELAGNYYYLFSRRNIFLIPRAAIKENILKTFHHIKSVSLESQWDSQTLVVIVAERQPAALLCVSSETCFFMDNSGFVFSPAPDFSDNIYLKINQTVIGNPIGQPAMEKIFFESLIQVAKMVEQILSENEIIKTVVTGVNIEENGDYELLITQPLPNEKLEWFLRFSLNHEATRALSNLEAVVKSADFKKDYLTHRGQLEYIDLRFGNKVFYRFK